ncbi:MAG: hypothetical protein ABIU09_11165, partial [Pyrinomonadaceae bacterium]
MTNNNYLRSVSTLLCAVSLLIFSTLGVKAAGGDLDSTFGIGGKVTTQTGYGEKGNAVAVQSD